MSRSRFLAALAVTLMSVLLVACGGSDGVTDPPAANRTIRYEMTGNYTGPLLVSFTSETGGLVNAAVTTLPWTRDVTYAGSVTSVAFTLSPTAAVPSNVGQTLTVRMLVGGSQVRTQSVTSDRDGQLAFGALLYVLSAGS